MARTKQDFNDTTDARGFQTFHLRDTAEDSTPLTGLAQRLHVNVAVPEIDDDGPPVLIRKSMGNVNDILIAAGYSGAQRQAFVNALQAIHAWGKAQ
jgi:hypothetical protein